MGFQTMEQNSAPPKTGNGERSVTWWKQEIRNGLEYQRIYGRPEDWRRFRAYYRHQWKKGTSMPVNMIFAIVRAMIPQVYFRDPRIHVTSLIPGYEMHAKVVEAVDNLLIKEMDMKKQLKRIALDAAIQGSAVGWSGYDSEYGFDKTKLNPMTGDSTLTQYDSKGYKIEYNSYVNPGMPWFQRGDLENAILPWGTMDVNNAEWTAMRVMRPLRDVISDSKYKNTAGLKPSGRTNVGTYSEDEQMYNRLYSQTEWVEMFQIRDMKTGQLIVINMDHDKFLRESADEMQEDGAPMHWFTFNDDPTYPWGIPDARIIEPQQLELNESRKLAMYHRRIAISKFLYKKGSITKQEIEKMLDEDVGAAVGVEFSEGSIDQVVKEFSISMPPELIQFAEVCRQDIRELTGFSRNQMGQMDSSRTTATEARIVQGAHEIRIDERRDQMADYLEAVMRKTNRTVFKFWGSERVVQIVGPNGLPGWIKYNGPELKSEYGLRIDPNNGTPTTGETRKADAMQLLQNWGAISQNPPPPELTKFIFSNFEGINQDKLSLELEMLRILPQGSTSGAGQQGAAGSSPSNPASMDQVNTQGGNLTPGLRSGKTSRESIDLGGEE